MKYKLSDVITKYKIDYNDSELLERIEDGESEYSSMESMTFGWTKGFFLEELRTSMRNSLSRLHGEAKRRGLAVPPSESLAGSGCALMLMCSMSAGIICLYVIIKNAWI